MQASHSPVSGAVGNGSAAISANNLDSLLERRGKLIKIRDFYQAKVKAGNASEGIEQRLKEIQGQVDQLTLDIEKEEEKLLESSVLDSPSPAASADNSASTSGSSAASTSIPGAASAPVDSSGSENVSIPVAALAPADSSHSETVATVAVSSTSSSSNPGIAPGGAFVPPEPEDKDAGGDTIIFTPTPGGPTAPELPPSPFNPASAVGNSIGAQADYPQVSHSNSAASAGTLPASDSTSLAASAPAWPENPAEAQDVYPVLSSSTSAAAGGSAPEKTQPLAPRGPFVPGSHAHQVYEQRAAAEKARAGQDGASYAVAVDAEDKAEAKADAPANTRLYKGLIVLLINLLENQLQKHGFNGFGSTYGAAAEVHTTLNRLKNILKLFEKMDGCKRKQKTQILYTGVAEDMKKLKIITPQNRIATERKVVAGYVEDKFLYQLIEDAINVEMAIFRAKPTPSTAPMYGYIRRMLALLPYLPPESGKKTEDALEKLAGLLHEHGITLPNNDKRMRLIVEELHTINHCVATIVQRNQLNEITQAQFKTLLTLIKMQKASGKVLDNSSLISNTETLTSHFENLRRAKADDVTYCQILIDHVANEAPLSSLTGAFITLDTSRHRRSKAVMTSVIPFRHRAHHYAEIINALDAVSVRNELGGKKGFQLTDSFRELCLTLSTHVRSHQKAETFSAIRAGLIELFEQEILDDRILKLISLIPWSKDTITPHIGEVFTGLVKDLCALHKVGMLGDIYPLLEQYVFPNYDQYAIHASYRGTYEVRLIGYQIGSLMTLSLSDAYKNSPEVKQAMHKILRVPVHGASLEAHKRDPIYENLDTLTQAIIELYQSKIAEMRGFDLGTLIDRLIAKPGNATAIVKSWMDLHSVGILDEESCAFVANNNDAPHQARQWALAVRSLGIHEYDENLAFLRKHREDAQSFHSGLIFLTKAGISGEIARKTLNRLEVVDLRLLKGEAEKVAQEIAATQVAAVAPESDAPSVSAAAAENSIAGVAAAAESSVAAVAASASTMSDAASSSSLSAADMQSSQVLPGLSLLASNPHISPPASAAAASRSKDSLYPDEVAAYRANLEATRASSSQKREESPVVDSSSQGTRITVAVI